MYDKIVSLGCTHYYKINDTWFQYIGNMIACEVKNRNLIAELNRKR